MLVNSRANVEKSVENNQHAPQQLFYFQMLRKKLQKSKTLSDIFGFPTFSTLPTTATITTIIYLLSFFLTCVRSANRRYVPKALIKIVLIKCTEAIASDEWIGKIYMFHLGEFYEVYSK